MTPPIPATIIGGPIELRDYDHLTIAQAHTIVFPNGTVIEAPAGTKLMRHCEGAAIRQMDGIATKGPAEEAPEA